MAFSQIIAIREVLDFKKSGINTRKKKLNAQPKAYQCLIDDDQMLIFCFSILLLECFDNPDLFWVKTKKDVKKTLLD